VKRTTKSKRFSLASNSGITLIELLVAITVALVIIGSAVALTMSSRQMYEVDRSRTELNQNLRGLVDIIGADVQVAGERLTSYGGSGSIHHPLAAVEVRNGNELFVRRNLLGDTLPVCQSSVNSATSVIRVSLASSTADVPLGLYPYCDLNDPASKTNADGIPAALAAWQDFRTENGPTVGAFIYKMAGSSDFFRFTGPATPNLTIEIESGMISSTYAVEEMPVMILVEERHYYLNDDVVELVINRDYNNPLRLTNRVSDFGVAVVTNDGVVHGNYLATGSDWSRLTSVELSITGEVVEGAREVERTQTSRFFPRNVLSN